MNTYIKKLDDIEEKTNLLIKELDIKFSAKRLFSFATLNLLDYEASNSFKILASENYEDLASKRTVETAMGTVEKVDKKTTKHQIFLLGNRKLLKLSKTDAINYLQKGLELIALYKQYRAIRDLLEAEFEYKFAHNISADNLFVIENLKDKELSEYIKYRKDLSNNSEYELWSTIIENYKNEELLIEKHKNEEYLCKLQGNFQ
ncbi:hypothetical protein O8C83_05875 [Aliarcobacter butzleri]|uniref:hypothetical protein n=1 Tax=Aliarcobacter butzleri TaxID=28197 RepID=UPI00263F1BCC|nr:hypothetical protein [Aliarcobacter butzleri]MDN5100345.1 hypothetical protein [Aliarcobacter butzleri]